MNKITQITKEWRPKKFLIAGKVTTYEFLLNQKENNLDEIAKSYGKKLEEEIDLHSDHVKTLSTILRTLHNKGYNEENIIFRPSRTYSEQDFSHEDLLVIALGGDGELLDVARIGGGKPHYMLVKSNNKSDGYLASADINSFESSLERVLNGDYDLIERTRVQAKIEYPDKKMIVDDALNEIFIGDLYSVGYPRYDLTHNGKTEHQRSNGIVIYSGTGSTAWAKNIPHKVKGVETTKSNVYYTPENYSPEEQMLKFVVREFDTNKNYQLTTGRIFAGQKLEIVSHIKQDGHISLDGSKPWYTNPRCYDFNHGTKVEIFISPEPVKVIKVR